MSITDDEQSVAAAAARLRWIRTPTLGAAADFADGTLNTCFNAADRHVALGRADEIALTGRSLVTAGTVELSFAGLTEQTASLAGILRALEVRAGDRVLIGLPVSVEQVIAMLAVARLGGAYLVEDSASRQLGVSAAITDGALPVERTIVIAPGEAAASQGQGDGEANGYEYRALMMSNAIRPVETVEVSATAPLRVAPLLVAGSPQVPAHYVTLCDNGSHAVALIQAALELSAAWELTNTDGPSRVIRLDGDQTDARSGHPCLAYAPLLLGFGAALPR